MIYRVDVQVISNVQLYTHLEFELKSNQQKISVIKHPICYYSEKTNISDWLHTISSTTINLSFEPFILLVVNSITNIILYHLRWKTKEWLYSSVNCKNNSNCTLAIHFCLYCECHVFPNWILAYLIGLLLQFSHKLSWKCSTVIRAHRLKLEFFATEIFNNSKNLVQGKQL